MFDVKQTAHLAELSKLSFTEEELNRITREMDEIVALMDTVADFSAEGDGFVLYYTDQCPFTYYWVPRVQEAAL